MNAETNLARMLASGKFTVTCEFTPPPGTDVDAIRNNAAPLKGKFDAVNVNDSRAASVRIAGWALSKILVDMGIEPIMEMTTRDRNRIALQSDLLGASALGIQNVLCLTGDHPSRGDQPQAKNVFDLDSIQWIAAARQLHDQGCLINGKKISEGLRLLIGGSANPFANSLGLHIIHLQKMIKAGAEFIQTQPVLDMRRFNEWLSLANNHGLTDQSAIIAGVIALKSVKTAEYLRNNVPGIFIPDNILDRLEAMPEDRQQEEGIKICIERIEELKKSKNVKGIHIMAIGCEERLPEIAERAGLLPRPSKV